LVGPLRFQRIVLLSFRVRNSSRDHVFPQEQAALVSFKGVTVHTTAARPAQMRCSHPPDDQYPVPHNHNAIPSHKLPKMYRPVPVGL
jgi:hypothetical protein